MREREATRLIGARALTHPSALSPNHAVRTAGSGREAMRVLEAGDFRVDLVLTDALMPEVGHRRGRRESAERALAGP